MWRRMKMKKNFSSSLPWRILEESRSGSILKSVVFFISKSGSKEVRTNRREETTRCKRFEEKKIEIFLHGIHTCIIDQKNFLEKAPGRMVTHDQLNQMTRDIKGPIEFPGKTWTRPRKRGETWRSPNHRVHLSRIIEWSKLILCSCMCVCISTLSLSLTHSFSFSLREVLV